LIVLAIIAVLAALSSAAYFYTINRSYERSTNAGIEHVYGVFKKQWNYVVEQAKKESMPDAILKAAAPDNPTGTDPSAMERAKVMLIMLRLAEAFPQSYAEVQTPAVVSYGIGKKYSETYYAKWALSTKTSGGPQNESSACLLMALTTSKGGATLDMNLLPTKPLDTDGDKLPELCDAWQKPMAFFRFPYMNAKLVTVQPSLTNQKGDAYSNPFDPMKTLTLWNSSTGNKKTFEDRILYDVAGGYFAPTIVSAGSDNVLDLQFVNGRNFPDMKELSNAAKDNKYSFDIVAP
jgi:hypothetical protein